MNTAITLRKLAVITAGLVLTATASMGHAQQKWMEEVLERQLQDQQLAKENANTSTEQKRDKEAEQPERDAPRDIDVSNTYNEQGEPII